MTTRPSQMPRYKLVIEYDGTPFVGWQRQANGRSVQQAMEEAMARLTGQEARVRCAGRTDAGVHATHQVVHVDLARVWGTDTLRDGLNAHLRPEPVCVILAVHVAGNFDARLSARARHYLYRILNRRPPLTLEANRAWHVARPLAAEAMHEAAQALVGRHDFTTFRAAACQATSAVRTLDRLDVARAGNEIRVHAAARSFLHHQVRSMVGSLELVGAGKWAVGEMRRALEARDRAACGGMAPAGGLYLVGVDYCEADGAPPDRVKTGGSNQEQEHA